MNKLNNINNLDTYIIIHLLIIFALILTPIFSFQESISLIFGGIKGNAVALTSPYIKGLKDIFSLLIIFMSLSLIVKQKKINKVSLFLFFLLILLCILPSLLLNNNTIIFFSGMRWIMPFILAIFLIGLINKKILKTISKILFYLFILHFTFQIMQLFFTQGWFGINSLGLPARNPGLFFIPNTAGFFTILVLFFSKFYMKNSKEKKIRYLIPLSLFLTASGTGLALYIIFMVLYFIKKNYLPLVPLLLVFLAIFLVFTLDTISGRNGLLEDSFVPRLIMFYNVFVDATYFPDTFGYGTSTGYLIANHYGLNFDMAVTDSWYATIIVNLGLVNSYIILILMIGMFIYAVMSKSKEKLLFFIIYSLFSATTIFTEVYPVNLLFAVLLAHYIQPKEEKTDETIDNT